MSAVGDLDVHQLAHARAMVGEVRRRGLPQRAAVIVIETALVESGLRIYANANVPASLRIPHEAVGSDHASVGVLQQQVPSWGTPADCMDPVAATGKFLDGTGGNPGLLHLPDYRFRFVGHPAASSWTQLPTGAAAQAVQVSAFPDRYQQQQTRAAQIVDALWSVLPEEFTVSPADEATIRKIIRQELLADRNANRRILANGLRAFKSGRAAGWFTKKTAPGVVK